MPERIRLSEISRINNSKIFFDANIWIYIFGNIGNYKKKEVLKYSNAYKQILRSDNQIYIDTIVMSEFVNRLLRKPFEILKKTPKLAKLKYKTYRKMPEYKETLEDISRIFKNNILRTSEIIDYNYDKINFLSLLDLDNIDMDFNDNHIANICNKKGMFLLTHDGDFKNSDVNIISYNNKFWK